MATRMVFIRHGNTGKDWGVFVGSTDMGLLGGEEEKARALGNRLKGQGIRAIYTSRLKRAWKSAEAIGKALGIRPVRMKELNEVDFGEWEMRSIKDVEKSHQDLLKDRKRDMWGVRPPGGESYSQARDRLMPVIESLIKKHEGETFAVVAHGALLKIVHSCLLGVPIERFYGMSFPFLGAFFFKKEGNKIRLEKEWL